MRFLLVAIVCAAGAITLDAQPKISAIVSSADFQAGVAYGGLGTVFGSGLSDADYPAGAIPWPKKLGKTELFACIPSVRPIGITEAGCEALELLFAGPGQINFRLFDSLPQKPGFAVPSFDIIARVNGQTSDGTPAGAHLNSYDQAYPRIFEMGSDKLTDARFISPTVTQTTRGAVTDQQGRLINSTNPARVGNWYSLWMTGLGQFRDGKPAAGFNMAYGEVPVFGYKGSTSFSAALSYIGPSQFPGLFQINFQLSPVVAEGKGPGYGSYFPCGDYQWEIALVVSQGARPANQVYIPVAVKNGDVTCAK